jgi:hypothetical protein
MTMRTLLEEEFGESASYYAPDRETSTALFCEGAFRGAFLMWRQRDGATELAAVERALQEWADATLALDEGNVWRDRMLARLAQRVDLLRELIVTRRLNRLMVRMRSAQMPSLVGEPSARDIASTCAAALAMGYASVVTRFWIDQGEIERARVAFLGFMLATTRELTPPKACLDVIHANWRETIALLVTGDK